MRVPVVATDIGGIPDMLPSEDYGLVVPVDDQAALERAMECALDRSWDRVAIAHHGASRSWSQVAVEVLDWLNEAVEERKRPR